MSPPGMLPSQQRHMLTSPEALGTSSSGGLMEASSPRHDGLNHWPLKTELNPQALVLCRGQVGEGGTESSNPLITWVAPLASSPILRWGLKVTSLP